MLDKLINNFSVRASEKQNVEVFFIVDPKVPITLIGDPLRLEQVLINLTDNAIKFTAEGEIFISIDVHSENNNEVTLQFAVKDSGIGMSDEQVNKLFQPFTQADSSTTRQYGGSGLGLTICQKLINLMGGDIWVKSKPQRGTTFIFNAAFRLGKEKRYDILKTPDKLRGMKVMVVADKAVSRMILEKILRSFSFNVFTSATLENGIKELKKADLEKSPYKLVVLEMHLPPADRIQSARRIKKGQGLSHIPAIIMTYDLIDNNFAQQNEAEIIDSFLTKPLSSPSLLNGILQLFSQKTKEVQEEKSPLHTEQKKSLNAIKGARILLVEDNEINRHLAKEMLENAGLVVTTANNGKEAVSLVKESSFDLVFMDVQMPVMDGLKATECIRKDDTFKDLPIIAMTAHAMSSDKKKSISTGMNDHISKPYNSEQLIQIIIKWIHPHSS